jgi:flagellar hook assembly protein FlgD
MPLQWDGIYKGKPIPDGTYYYNIKYTFANGTQYVAKGNVTILR